MHDPYAALRIPNFRAFITTKFLVTLYIQIQAVVVGWQLYELTNDPLSLGLVGLTEVIPALSVSLVAGYIADNFPKKRIIASCYVVFLVSISILMSFSYYKGEFISLVGTLPIYVAIALNGFARGFASPSNFSLMTELVSPDTYTSSASWNSTAWELGAVFGPLLGGFAYATAGATAAYLLALCLVLCAIFFFSRIDAVSKTVVASEREPILKSVQAGLQFVFSSKIVLTAITLDLFAVLFGGAVALLPVFAKDILQLDAIGLGALRGSSAVGAGLTALFLAYQPTMQRPWRNLLLAIAVFGLATIGFALSRNFYLSLGFLFVLGGADSVSVIIRSTIMQLFTPSEMRGRVASVNSMFISSSNEIGAFESGVAARLLGTVSSVVFGGCVTLLVVAIAKWRAPFLDALDFTKKTSDMNV